MAYPGPTEDEAQTTDADLPPGGDAPDDAAMPANTDYPEISLDKSNPDIADAFEGCKVGDEYKVVGDDDTMIRLQKTGSPDAEPDAPPSQDDEGNEAAPESPAPKGAVAILMAKKMKR